MVIYVYVLILTLLVGFFFGLTFHYYFPTKHVALFLRFEWISVGEQRGILELLTC